MATARDLGASQLENAQLRTRLDEAERRDRWERVGMQLSHLPERDQQVLQWRYLTPDRQKLSVVGEQLGCSRERARQIEQRALMRLRLRMAS